ncbi:myo-inositol/proton symporter (MIT) [Trypanosoma equiperdum]|uniref:Sugar transporter, putative n=2 Tax=Trypanozoon TaxID=39700 RepID=Q385N3_TRYB2|nr:sugar transporter, putative [Trypanosoma brucei brucei TREU927]EAN79498.1 sugar transporter, putative [Trypanosoma brucei brucei TREU927]SCU66377.1 myo-inositol/proton symporter (MIT) [Trypanosoma equiperdum]
MKWRVKIFAALGGFLFGYDTSVINGALFQMKEHFDFPAHSWISGLIVSIAIAGAFVGAFASGFISVRWGRRSCIALADIFFTLGSIMMAFAPNVEVIFVGRAIVGLGIGICSATIPVYLAEITSAGNRGSSIVFNNVCLTGAQFIASVVTALLVQFTGTNFGWRVALGLGAVPSVIQFVGLIFFLPESPRWYLATGRVEKALKTSEMYDIDIVDCAEGGGLVIDYRALFSTVMRRRLLIGCMLHILQQTSGINTIMYYSSVILYDAGFKDPKTPVLLSIPLAAINTLFSLFGVFTVDRWGRRLLLQISACGCFVVTVGMTVVGFMLDKQIPYEIGGWIFLSLLGFYLVFFAPGLGAMPWVVMGEIFPNTLRTSAASVATMCNWGSNALVSQVFPIVLGSIGVGGTFSLLCACIIAAVLFIQFFVVETKGLTLEEIEEMFDPRARHRGSDGSQCSESCSKTERENEGEGTDHGLNQAETARAPI